MAVDFEYLETYAGGDLEVVADVLRLFRSQAEIWLAGLDDPAAGWRDLAHAIKGSAKGIGAVALGDLADVAEQGDASLGPPLRAALVEVLAEIEGYLSRVSGG